MLKRVKKYILIVFLGTGFVHAQDIHFSQFYFSPLSLNPANTGNFLGDYRFAMNYRSQWREIQKAYKTVSLSGEANLYPKNQQTSVGLYFLNDKSGGNLIVNKIYASGAFHKKIAGVNLHLGVQPGIVLKSIDFNAHTFPNQMNWDKGQFDNSLANNETYISQKTSYFDLNAGAGASTRIGKFEAGLYFAMFHITKPKESLYANNNKLPVRNMFNLDARYYLNEKLTFNLYSMVDGTTKASDWVTGVNLDYNLNKTPFFTNAVFIGFMWRNGVHRISDAGIVTCGLKYKSYTAGVSYDINISTLHTATDYRGAIEFALIYTSKNTRLVKKQIPCDRY
ncbi:MAG TPA: PorP/SprF family type IX secretion system membrane protein [Bacteroidia bacterium]|jgi:type IX secretion system PorP/SprF family membrane protein|nr:PorP/SprF family type IX secretion system membrane protein [Bacteroidia bacterium]